MSMQSRQNVWRSACKARNSYNPVLALRAAFSTSASCLEEDDALPSTWEVSGNSTRNTARYDPNKQLPEAKFRWAKGAGARTDKVRRADGSRVIRTVDPGNPPSGPLVRPDRRTSKSSAEYFTLRHAIQFSGHAAWKPHMGEVREEAYRTQQSQWWKDERSVPLQRIRRFIDYDPVVVLPEPSRLGKGLPRLPWALSAQERRTCSVAQGLSHEIERFARWLTPTLAEKRARTAVVREVKELISTSLDPSTTSVELFGSEKNGIALPLSDIDVRIYDPTDPEAPFSRLAPRLHRLATAIHSSDKFMMPIVRPGAHPILNCQHRASGIDIQIVASGDSTPQQRVVAEYIHQIPYLREIYCIVRTILGMRGLVDVFTGGMGSYGTFVMVLAILARKLDYSIATPPAPEQLAAFLNFYRDLDTRKYCVAVHPRTLFKKHESTADALQELSIMAEKRGDSVRAGQWELCLRRPFQPYLLCLQDPANPLNDLGRKGHAIKHISATLAYLSRALEAGTDEVGKWKRLSDSTIDPPPSLLLPLVGRCHEVYYERRRLLEEYGNTIAPEAGEPQVGWRYLHAWEEEESPLRPVKPTPVRRVRND